MNPKEIKNMIDFIAKSGLAEVNIETEEFKIKVKRDTEAHVVSAPAAAPAPAPVAAAPAQAAAPAPAEATPAKPAEDTKKYVEIKSPMIGTFYRSPKPEDPAFVNVGDTVSAGDKVCIVEAMKLFNEIESEVSGTIVKVLVENASPVEYDQPLFLVDPA
ncbi:MULTISPECIES: acetyl-CoA carboxylase biotin carboxyl carrier protein [Roseivirga]|jgi:acetyl-CoA carboxylase biotin carboxyl carrier protein|uniref:Biotin carboxyl carrier protein of acetyl-CoA carboxylase n=1 Tax=Roseivirga thermotolerans TaxID=1758176 RepID=A0ABQ3I798_9BACT|nr:MULTISPECIES: acetyl-CoA carboxylase biotin carboxyl carrier protein [Roseivirga]MEC7754172.1 acetyl-CoA carboxylase biotin carboxyl carrier protein [Bacteroidota bacterium]GHE60273.1 acetyl-CoA carboxylase biotin carboxyl carrier protein subunit [Roseivirga thermotolerans]|tara:strand:- start:543 stop:1019 length:477 start_codon:yes stop_codon:yes gene_type:complete